MYVSTTVSIIRHYSYMKGITGKNIMEPSDTYTIISAFIINNTFHSCDNEIIVDY